MISRLASIPQLQATILKFIDKLKQELIRARTALDSGNFDELAIFAHWLKGSAGTVGFDEFTEPAANLEMAAKTGQTEPADRLLDHVQRLSDAIVPPTAAHGQPPTTPARGDQPIAGYR